MLEYQNQEESAGLFRGFNYIEITYAIDGYDEILRYEKLENSISVPKFGTKSITNSKASGSRTVILDGVSPSHNKIIEECKKLILERVKDKARKQEKNIYPDKTMLIVAFDDMSFKSEEDISEIKLFMLNELNPIVGKFSGLALVGKFSGLALVGNSDKVFLVEIK